MRKMAVSALQASTAPGVLETDMPRAAQAWASMESYPAPLCDTNLRLEGRASTSS